MLKITIFYAGLWCVLCLIKMGFAFFNFFEKNKSCNIITTLIDLLSHCLIDLKNENNVANIREEQVHKTVAS